MPGNILEVGKRKIFPFQFQILGYIFLLVGTLSILLQPLAAPFLVIMGLMVITGNQGIEFDLGANLYRDFKSFFFLKFGKWQPHEPAELIFINKSRSKQKIYTGVTEGSAFYTEDYDAYLVLTDENTLYLTSNRDLELVKRKVSPLSIAFQIEIQDNT